MTAKWTDPAPLYCPDDLKEDEICPACGADPRPAVPRNWCRARRSGPAPRPLVESDPSAQVHRRAGMTADGMTAPLTALLERVEAAEGPDVELDIAIVMAIYPDIGAPAAHCIGDEPIFWHDPYRKQPPPLLTSSVDAALALVERALPAVWVRLDSWDGDYKKVAAILPKPAPNSVCGGIGATLPLAILAAMLKGLIAKDALASRDAAGPADAEGV